MKRYAALALALTMVLCTFAACGKKKLNGGEYITDAGGKEYAVATQKDGGITRGVNGDVIIYATDEDGQAYTDVNGETVTTFVDLRDALVIGNLIEFERFYIELPDGWSNYGSYSDMIFRRDGTEDQIHVMELSGTSVAETYKSYKSLREISVKNNEGAVVYDTSIKVNGEGHPYCSLFLEATEDEPALYYAETYLENYDYVYIVRVTSDRNLTDNLDEIANIISTIKFK